MTNAPASNLSPAIPTRARVVLGADAIATSLLDKDSAARASELYVAAMQAQGQPLSWWDSMWNARSKQLASPPETYVIKYYVSKKDGENPFSWVGPPKDFVGIKTTAVMANQQRAIDDAITNLQAQFPGRFRFEQTAVADEAQVRFCGYIPPQESITKGVTFGQRSIALRNETYGGVYSSDMAMTAYHELLHALGVQHSEGHLGNLYSSMMTSIGDNQAGDAITADTIGAGFPIGAMPADIQALLTLYPIAADRRHGAALIGPPATMQAKPEFPATLLSDLGKGHVLNAAIKFAPEALAFQPAPDTKRNILRLGDNETSKKRMVEQRPDGVLLTLDQFSNTLVPVYVEHYELGSGTNTYLYVEDNVSITVPLIKKGTRNGVTVKDDGKRDRQATIDVHAQTLNDHGLDINLSRAAAMKVIIHDATQLTDSSSLVDGAGWAASWMRKADGVYDITTSFYKGEPSSGHFTIALDDPSAAARQSFERALPALLGYGDDISRVQHRPTLPPQPPIPKVPTSR